MTRHSDLPPDPLPPPDDDCGNPLCMAHTLTRMGFDDDQIILVMDLMQHSFIGGASVIVHQMLNHGVQVVVAPHLLEMDEAITQMAFEKCMESRTHPASPEVAKAMRRHR